MALILKKFFSKPKADIGNPITAPVTAPAPAKPTAPVQLTAPKPGPKRIVAAPRNIDSPFPVQIGGDWKNSAPSAPAPVSPAGPVNANKPKKIVIAPNTRWKASPPLAEAPAPPVSNVKPDPLTKPAPSKWVACPIGTRVVITNNLFPWVKHYKPGDSGLVTSILNNKDPMAEDDAGHNMHVIHIDRPLDPSRKGYSPPLFRWEFEPQSATAPTVYETTKKVSADE